MSDVTADQSDPEPKSGKRIWLLATLGALVLGAGAFSVLYFELLFSEPEPARDEGEISKPMGLDIDFVPLDSLVVSLGPGASASHLVVTMQLEVAKNYVSEVEFLKPRIADVLNSYLRALKPEDIEQTGSLIRLRAQMLRRLQIVVGDGRIRDLLITEFVLN